ncbi:MAG: HD domain-containing protein [Chitinophagales bacterium]
MWRERLTELARELKHPAWGYDHGERVYRLALDLAGGEPIDEAALFAAARLHDLGAFAPYRQIERDHALRSAEVAPQLLAEAGFPAGKTALVQEIIRGHMFDAEPGPSREAVFFHDADTLDFLGAVGAARLLAVVGLDDWTPDLPAAVALLRRFALELPARVHSSRARDLARTRQAELNSFLEALASATYGFRLL